MTTRTALARAIGLFSIGLGVTQLVAPRRFARGIGVDPYGGRAMLVRLIGLREVAAGVGLMTRRPSRWMWMRVAGDVMDMTLLGRSSQTPQGRAGRAAAAMTGVAGITAVDLLGSVATTAGDSKDGADGTSGQATEGGIKPVRKSITIARSPEDLYAHWRDLQRLPTFMRHLEEVQEQDERRSHWVARAPLGMRVEWDAELTEDEPGRRISWRSLPNSPVQHEGTVRFEPAPGERGTEVHVEMAYKPPAGMLGVAVAKLTGEEPEQQVSEDLRRFKQVMETGSVVRSEAILGGRRIRQRPAQPTGEPAPMPAASEGPTGGYPRSTNGSNGQHAEDIPAMAGI